MSVLNTDEFNKLCEWANGSTKEQQETIIDNVLIGEPKGRRPHMRRLILKAFRLAAER